MANNKHTLTLSHDQHKLEKNEDGKENAFCVNMKTASTAAVHDLFMVFAFYHATGYEWFSGHPYIYLACLPAHNTPHNSPAVVCGIVINFHIHLFMEMSKICKALGLR